MKRSSYGPASRRTHPGRWARRHRLEAATWLLWALGAMALAVAAIHLEAPLPAAIATAAAFATAGLAWRSARLARRNRIGHRAELDVRRVLRPLTTEGWKVRHAMSWKGPGDIDHCVLTPRLAVAIETKARSVPLGTHERVSRQAAWLAVRNGRARQPLAVICLVTRRNLVRWERGVLVCSPDVLPELLRSRERGP